MEEESERWERGVSPDPFSVLFPVCVSLGGEGGYNEEMWKEQEGDTDRYDSEEGKNGEKSI